MKKLLVLMSVLLFGAPTAQADPPGILLMQWWICPDQSVVRRDYRVPAPDGSAHEDFYSDARSLDSLDSVRLAKQITDRTVKYGNSRDPKDPCYGRHGPGGGQPPPRSYPVQVTPDGVVLYQDKAYLPPGRVGLMIHRPLPALSLGRPPLPYGGSLGEFPGPGPQPPHLELPPRPGAVEDPTMPGPGYRPSPPYPPKTIRPLPTLTLRPQLTSPTIHPQTIPVGRESVLVRTYHAGAHLFNQGLQAQQDARRLGFHREPFPPGVGYSSGNGLQDARQQLVGFCAVGATVLAGYLATEVVLFDASLTVIIPAGAPIGSLWVKIGQMGYQLFAPVTGSPLLVPH